MTLSTKQRLIDAGLVMESVGMGDFTRGHISIRDPDDASLFYMKPHSMGFEEITLDNIVVCNLDGEKIGGEGRRHSEVFIHSEILRARPELNSVVHAHPPQAVVYSASMLPWMVCSQSTASFMDDVSFFEGTIDLIRNSEMGHRVAEAMGKTSAVFMRGHGVTVSGATIEESILRTITLENACQEQLLAATVASTLFEFDSVDIGRLKQKLNNAEQFTINFDYLLRKAKRRFGV